MDKKESKKRKLTKKMKRKLAGVFAVTLLAFAGLLTGITRNHHRPERDRAGQQCKGIQSDPGLPGGKL